MSKYGRDITNMTHNVYELMLINPCCRGGLEGESISIFSYHRFLLWVWRLGSSLMHVFRNHWAFNWVAG